MKEAARERAEGDKVVQVKIAEAAAEVRLIGLFPFLEAGKE